MAKNGSLCVVLSEEDIAKLLEDAHQQIPLEIDLPNQVVRRSNGEEYPFQVDEVSLRSPHLFCCRPPRLGRRSMSRPRLPADESHSSQFRKHCLINGLDEISLTLEHEKDIAAFEERRSREWPWLDGESPPCRPGHPSHTLTMHCAHRNWVPRKDPSVRSLAFTHAVHRVAADLALLRYSQG